MRVTYIWSVVFKIFKSSKGVMDLQSVMVGVLVSAIVAGVSMVSIVGVMRMTAIDSGKSSLRVLSTGMESYYTQYDKYPINIEALAAEEFVPKTYVANVNSGILCLKVDTTTAYPQSYTAGVKVSATNDLFFVTENQRKPLLESGINQHCFI
jgi:Tfp pilus assembly protein PilE